MILPSMDGHFRWLSEIAVYSSYLGVMRLLELTPLVVDSRRS